ncbi:flagellar basal-body rod protein FlgB [Sphaerotilus sulfidivorans]|uniref:Flagellar basal body rod protein FlgB n=1 Tax=Sphaerotilus sulfidivorans TaxID=639200 RepID=A0A5C1PZN9_9BURK|nr:flagellar basal body rod protein FlgB [Sphaerotilus sulfidivorans]NZD44285.1 flagellar basal body rod protein FlgB [Sphaerotilus sulfidivorans]QEN00189.1 flagellar basal body rod protein FlgB [Sphaerotilus sulfidivorans]
MLNRLDSSLGFQSQALLLRAERQRLIASNIANADTPGYQARDLDFATALRQATGGSTVPAVAMAGTSERHLGIGRLPATREASLLYALPSQTNLDGNSVDMDRERASFADNAVKYEASLRFINGSVRTMLDAIKGQ